MPIAYSRRSANSDRFFKGLLASLRLHGAKYISVLHDRHHDCFDRVVISYREAIGEGSESFDNFPKIFPKSPVTGKYRDLDEALLRLQHGMLGAQNPFYPSVEINFSESFAESVLAKFETNERKLLDKLAAEFVEEHRKAVEVD